MAGKMQETLELDEMSIAGHRLQPVVRVSLTCYYGYVSGSIVPIEIRIDGERLEHI